MVWFRAKTEKLEQSEKATNEALVEIERLKLRMTTLEVLAKDIDQHVKSIRGLVNRKLRLEPAGEEATETNKYNDGLDVFRL